MYDINDIFLELVRNDYSGELSEGEYELDCSLGENPLGILDNVKIKTNIIDKISHYPHSDDILLDKIIKKYKKNINLSSDNIALTCGSIGGLLSANRLFLRKNKDVIGISPQFSAAIDDFNSYESIYHPVYLDKNNNFKFDVEQFIGELSKYKNSYIYIDNPNNPTGQIIDIEDIKKLLDVARTNNSFVCIDEAYGDYMAIENSAVSLIDEFDNLLVLRTISKGLSGAGLRVGYVVSNKNLIKVFNKVNIPFSVSEISKSISAELMDYRLDEKAVDFSRKNKSELKKILKNIKMAHTSVDVPISMLYVEDKNIDLEKVFLRGKIRTVSCRGYIGLDKNCIRINLHKDFERMKELVKIIDSSIVV